MGVLYIIALILLIFWALGFFVWAAGNLIHVLLVVAIIAVIYELISGRRL